MTGSMRVTTLAIAAVGALVACQAPMATYESTDPVRRSTDHGDGGTAEGGSNPPGSNGEPPTDQGDAGPTTPPEPIDWVGGVPFTSFSPFGPSACRYNARYENVTVTVKITANHKLASATVGAKDVEQVSAGCSSNPKPTPRAGTNHVWTYAPASATDSKVIVKSADGDSPQTELSIEVGVDSDTQAWTTLSWKRTDQTDPWQWTIGPQYVPLSKK